MRLGYGDKLAATADIGYGPFEIVAGSYGELHFASPDAEVHITISVPDANDPVDLRDGVQLTPRSGKYSSQLDVAGAEALGAVLVSATEVAAQINLTHADAIAEAKKAREREEAAREKAKAAREKVIKERTERLLNEFVGETVKVREAGYKTMRQAIVDAREVRGEYNYDTNEYAMTGEYKPSFSYTGRDARTQRVERIQRLDVKVGASWRTVWDDGVEDLPSWERDRPAGSAKPVKKYDGELG